MAPTSGFYVLDVESGEELFKVVEQAPLLAFVVVCAIHLHASIEDEEAREASESRSE